MEIWKKIEGFENYSVSDQGRVRRDNSGRILKPGKNIPGYLMVSLYKNGKKYNKSIHRLVAEHFIPNPENRPEVNHRNAVKTDNRLENLEWSTRLENMKHAFEAGIISRVGEKNGTAKLTEFQVLEIRQLLTQGLTQKAIGDLFGVHAVTISYIKSGRLWAHI